MGLKEKEPESDLRPIKSRYRDTNDEASKGKVLV